MTMWWTDRPKPAPTSPSVRRKPPVVSRLSAFRSATLATKMRATMPAAARIGRRKRRARRRMMVPWLGRSTTLRLAIMRAFAMRAWAWA
jgi:hypothetical protein